MCVDDIPDPRKAANMRMVCHTIENSFRMKDSRD